VLVQVGVVEIRNHALMISVSEHTDTVKKLASLHILNEQSQTGRLPGWRLNEVFRKNLKIALTGGYAVLLKSLFSYVNYCRRRRSWCLGLWHFFNERLMPH